MVDDGSPPSEDEYKNDPKQPEEPQPAKHSQVDSLVINKIGGITAGQAKNSPGIKKTAHKFLSRGLDLWPSTKNQKIAGGFIIAVLLIGGVTGVYALMKSLSKSPEQPAPIVQRIEKSTEPSRLTGVEIPKKLNKRPVTAVMIENSLDARPQSGLSKAGIVFEAIAEGGITRFNALYLEGQPNSLGPVRSVRPYYIDLFLPFDAAIAHAGGSGEGLAKIVRLHVKDLDYLRGTNAYHRISQRYAPHNLYTSMKALDKASKAKGFFKTGKFTSWLRKEEDPAKKPKITSIDFTLSGLLYNVHYTYDAKDNRYKRREGGAKHIDASTNKQLAPKVVVALVMHYSHNGEYSVYRTKGKGTMFVFQDGRVQKGVWKKKGSRSQFKFLDQNGNELALNPGQTWVTLLDSINSLKYGH